MSLIKGLHHAALRCCGKAEMDSVIEFYCRVLGMKLDNFPVTWTAMQQFLKADSSKLTGSKKVAYNN